MNISHNNPYLDELDNDYLYHLGLHSKEEAIAQFADTKYVCMGGSPDRARAFAIKVANDVGIPVPEGGPQPIGKQERCLMFKIGPVISVSHGMGMPSMSIFLHELKKLMEYAGATDYSFIRIGTSGGVGVNGGDVVVTDVALNAELEPKFETFAMSEKRIYPTDLDANLRKRILAANDDVRIKIGATVGTDDFYEGQGRADGGLDPGYSVEDKLRWLEKIYLKGGRNIEMESTAFAAFCKRANIPGAIVCAALLNRMNGDQITTPPEELAQYSDFAQKVVTNFIRADLADLRSKVELKP